jgi:Domain of unknown function DUF11
MRSASTRALTAVLAACVVIGFGTASFGQGGGNDDGFRDASERADARGGNGGDVRGGDGGRGGSGFLPVCNQNSSDGDYQDATVDCIAGSSGGNGGNAGESVGGNGGVAFTIGPPPRPPPQQRQALADLLVRQARGSFRITITNLGPDTASNIVLTDTLTMDTEWAFSGVAASQGMCTAPPPGLMPPGSSATFTCALGNLAPGASAVVVISDPVIVEIGHAVNNAVVTSNTPDPDATNNGSSFKAELTPAP